MACEDTRQLTEQQRQDAFNQQRTGVQRAVRPFTGRPTLDNLIDYINRELQPAVRATRDAVNEVYLPVVDNAPSANPLAFYFSTETGAADPTAGRIRLNQAPQDTATIVRLSEDNARLQDVLPWLEVMAGGVTAPLGVITLYDAVNPSRFLRFDLESMTDQGDYWDLGVTVVESSHDNPFVDGGAVTLSYIPGVADNEGAGASVPVSSLSDISQSRFLGRAEGAGSGPPTEITPTQAVAIIDGETVTWTGSHTFNGTNFAVGAGADALIAATSGVGLFAGVAASNVANNDVVINAIGGSVAIVSDTTTPVTDPSGGIIVQSVADVRIHAGSGIGLFAAHASSDIGNNDIALNAVGSIAIVSDATTPVTDPSGGILVQSQAAVTVTAVTNATVTATADIDIAAGDDLRMNGVAGAAVSALATGLPTAPATGTLDLRADTAVRLITAGTEWLEIEADGGFQVNGSVGTAGLPLVTAGASGPPSWAQLGTAGLADASVTPIKIAPGIHTLVGAGPHADIAIAATVTTILCEVTCTITSIANGWNGRRIAIINDGGNTLTVQHGSGTAGNQIALPDAVSYSQLRGGMLIEYDTSTGTGTWRIIATAEGLVPLTRMSDLAQSRIIGRAEGAGTGIPQALTPTQVVSIIDGETATWTGSHTFNGTAFTVSAGADALIRAASGIGLFAAHTSSAIADNDIALNAVGSIAIVSDATTPVTDPSGGILLQSQAAVTATAVTNVALTATVDVVITASDDITLTSTDDIDVSAGDDLRLNGIGGTLIAAQASASAAPAAGLLDLRADTAVRVATSLCLIGVITPSALTADQNNYNPTGWATANVVRLSTDGTSATVRDITGAAAGVDGEIKYLVNLGPGDIRLQYEHASSTNINRFLFASLTTFTLDPEDMAGIWYDGTSDRWRVLWANPVS